MAKVVGSSKRIAIVGAGPVGLEAALYAGCLGHRVRVYERGRIGDNIRRWGHVRLFSPWHLECSALALEHLRRAGVQSPDPAAYPTGGDYVARYLEPLSRLPALREGIHEHTAVVSIGRERIGKLDGVGGGREAFPFRLLLDGARGERIDQADIVLDCSGTYGNANWLGDGNVPALGERELRQQIAYTLADVAGSDRARYEGRRVLVIGAGLSAATALDALVELRGTRVSWAVRSAAALPYEVIEDDLLPERARLARRANALAQGAEPRLHFRPGTTVQEIRARGAEFVVRLRSGTRETSDVFDRILALVGYRPDRSIYRELQFHECYASYGPIKLAAALLAGGSSDCLAQTAHGPETLRNPEPNFFVLGSKSYGLNSSFLIRVGHQQVRDVFTLIENRPELDLYAA